MVAGHPFWTTQYKHVYISPKHSMGLPYTLTPFQPPQLIGPDLPRSDGRSHVMPRLRVWTVFSVKKPERHFKASRDLDKDPPPNHT